MFSDIAIRSDLSSRHYVCEGPNPGAIADPVRIDKRKRMREERAFTLFDRGLHLLFPDISSRFSVGKTVRFSVTISRTRTTSHPNSPLLRGIAPVSAQP